jgi:hypothetical protein
MRTWPRLLRAIGFGGPTFFPDLGTERLAGKRMKEARILTGLVLLALVTFTLGAIMFVQLSALKNEVASLKRELAGTMRKLAKLEANVASARSNPNEVKDGAGTRMPASAGSMPRAPLALSRDEIQLILDFIKVPPAAPGAMLKINVGDLLPDTALAPFPEPIVRKVPELVGARYGVRNGAIVVVAPGSNRVEVIINPS